MAKECSIEGCNKPLRARGWCLKHWSRWKRHGDPMRVKTHKEYIPSGPSNHAYRHGCEQHPLYHTWQNMMRRCYKQSGADYARYGARGITVSKRWHDVRHFIADMEPRPEGATLERKDNSRGYSKANCVWASRATQSRNRRTTKLSMAIATAIRKRRAAGEKMTDMAREYGVYPGTIKKIVAGTIWKPQ